MGSLHSFKDRFCSKKKTRKSELKKESLNKEKTPPGELPNGASPGGAFLLIQRIQRIQQFGFSRRAGEWYGRSN